MDGFIVLRALAMTVDMLTPWAVIVASWFLVATLHPNFDHLDPVSQVIMFPGLFLVPTVWFTLLGVLATFGTSPAKWMVGLRIVRLDGARPGFLRAVVIRAGVPMVVSAVAMAHWLPGWPLAILLDYSAMAFGTGRPMHDVLAGTDVVLSKPGRSVWLRRELVDAESD